MTHLLDKFFFSFLTPPSPCPDITAKSSLGTVLVVCMNSYHWCLSISFFLLNKTKQNNNSENSWTNLFLYRGTFLFLSLSKVAMCASLSLQSHNVCTLRAPHTSTVCSSSTTTMRKYLVWNMDFRSFPRAVSLQPERTHKTDSKTCTKDCTSSITVRWLLIKC